MKNSPHHLKHIKDKAVKEAQAEGYTEESPEEMIENPEWKNQFKAEEAKELPHHVSHKHKKVSKRTSKRVMHTDEQPTPLQHGNENAQKMIQAKSDTSTAKLNKKLSKKHMKPYKKAS